MILIVVAAASASSATYLVASILGGAGFGAAFLGGLRALVVAFEAWSTQPRRMLVRQEVAHAEA